MYKSSPLSTLPLVIPEYIWIILWNQKNRYLSKKLTFHTELTFAKDIKKSYSSSSDSTSAIPFEQSKRDVTQKPDTCVRARIQKVEPCWQIYLMIARSLKQVARKSHFLNGRLEQNCNSTTIMWCNAKAIQLGVIHIWLIRYFSGELTHFTPV